MVGIEFLVSAIRRCVFLTASKAGRAELCGGSCGSDGVSFPYAFLID